MSYLDYLKVIDKGAHQVKSQVEVAPGVKVDIFSDVKAYEMPLDRENLLTEIYDKMYLSHPLTYQQKQVMDTYDIMRKRELYSFAPTGFVSPPPKIGMIPKMSVKKKGLKKRK